VVIAARTAMDWLQETARVVAQTEKPIKWTTPVGFPVIQDYPKQATKQIQTIWGGVRLQLRLQHDTDKIDKHRMTNAISPNLIHSLDAAHLMLTVNKCLSNDITSFGMVHDSYGTHAGNVAKMNHLLREAFIELYSKDVLRGFRDEILAQLPDELKDKVPPLPEQGSLDLPAVAESRYFFA
jgi:DNA-directed RNA polymerase